MRQFCENLYQQLQVTLLEISSDPESSDVRKARDCKMAAKDALLQLKEYIVSYTFAGSEEEITFFKEIQPKFYSLLIYYIHILLIETRSPVGSKEQQLSYLQNELNQVFVFFELNQEIYRYYRLEETYADEQYFVRDRMSNNVLTEDTSLLYDNRFSTEMGYKLARIRSNEMLRPFIEKRMENIISGKKDERMLLKWKQKKVHLAELIYLLWANGAFGNVKLKTVVDNITFTWNCPLSNIYKIIEEIRIRKKERFVYTRQLLIGGERQMDADDLKAK